MISDDIKILNDHHCHLKHYNKNVAESWYRIRNVVECMRKLVENEFTSNNQNIKERQPGSN